MRHFTKIYNILIRKFIYIFIAIILLIIDLYSKQYIANNFEYNRVYPFINKLLNIHYIHNKGAAFSILSGKIFLLLIPAIVFIVIAIYLLLKQNISKNILITITLLLAGATGNVYDRILFGYVRDFFEFKFVKFAIFNIADIYITIAAILLILFLIINPKEDK